MRRSLLLLVALLLAAPACSTFGKAPAATVNGHEISMDVVNDEISTIRDNEPYNAALEESFGRPIATGGTFDAAFAAQILTIRVYADLVERDLASRGVRVTDEAIAGATAEIEQQFSQLGPDGLEAFPDSYREQLVHQRALFALAQQDVIDRIGEDPEAFFDENEDEFAEICLSHVLVSVQGGRDPVEAQAAAQDLYDRIEAGEEFEAIATNESDDTTAAAEGGSLGCGSRQTLQFDPTFEAAAFALEEGVVSEPVQTQFGSHLILVTERELPTYVEVADQVPSVMQAAGQTRIDEYFMRIFCDADVAVNPRYGTWVQGDCSDVTQPPHVEPPEGPQGSREGLEFEL